MIDIVGNSWYLISTSKVSIFLAHMPFLKTNKDIKKVYSIIFYENSPSEFHKFPEHNLHRSRQQTDTGLNIELLQEFLFIPLDIAQEIYHNKGIENKLEAWLVFLSSDNPEDIAQLLETHPEFRKMYEDICSLCQNTERMMEMFSKELQQLDRNTVQYMIDEMQNKIDEQKSRIDEQKSQIDEQKSQLQEKDSKIAELEETIRNLTK